ncbi:MAG: glycosyltransferase family 39 protein [Ardenticatenaceae bacterium]|nr:glycosyltransferase family 39 protein [Ardenticatenaceae bacterium]
MKPKRQSPYVHLSLLVLLAVILRIPNISRDSLWFDEAISYLTAQLPLTHILDNTIQSSHPPLYYLLLHFWQNLVPPTDAGLRSLGLLWNILLVVFIYILTEKLFDKRPLALWSAFLVAISPFHILYSHELRMYTQLMLLVTIGTYAYWQARSTQRRLWWLIFGAVFLAAIYTHLFAFLPLAGIGLHALLYHQDRRAFWRTSLIIFMLCLAFIPWLRIIASESQKELGSLRPFTQEILNPIKPLTTATFLVFGEPNQPVSILGFNAQPVYVGIILFLMLAMIALFLLEIRRIRQEGTPSGLMLILLIIACVLGVPILVYMIRPFFLPDRTMAAASPFLLILLAWATTRRQTPLPYLVYGTAAFMLIGTLIYHTGSPLKPPYRDAIQFITANRQEGDAILHTSDGSYLPALRYVQLPHHALLAGDPDPRKPRPVYEIVGGQVWEQAQAQKSGDRLWLIVALEHSIEWQQEQVTHFNNTYPQLETHDFGGIAVILYQLNQNAP